MIKIDSKQELKKLFKEIEYLTMKNKKEIIGKTQEDFPDINYGYSTTQNKISKGFLRLTDFINICHSNGIRVKIEKID